MRTLASLLSLTLLVLGQKAMADTCVGSCGLSGANGVVTLSPYDSSQYDWISTSGGIPGAGQMQGVGGTNGSTLTTDVIHAAAGDELSYYFNYVTSDGGGYEDYAWAWLLNAAYSPVAVLFDARTQPAGSISPGVGLPTPVATVIPPHVPFTRGAPVWSPLGAYSGTCWDAGCGYTGWIESIYFIPSAGDYRLQFGVANWTDTYYNSGMAIDGAIIGGAPFLAVPEPSALILLGSLTGMLAKLVYLRTRALP